MIWMRKVELSNGQIEVIKTLSYTVELFIARYKKNIEWRVISLVWYDVIFVISWIEQYNPNVDLTRKVITSSGWKIYIEIKLDFIIEIYHSLWWIKHHFVDIMYVSLDLEDILDSQINFTSQRTSTTSYGVWRCFLKWSIYKITTKESSKSQDWHDSWKYTNLQICM